VSGKPIKFVGVGEKMESLEPFYPERMASRILGQGDVLSLYEKAESAIKVGLGWGHPGGEEGCRAWVVGGPPGWWVEALLVGFGVGGRAGEGALAGWAGGGTEIRPCCLWTREWGEGPWPEGALALLVPAPLVAAKSGLHPCKKRSGKPLRSPTPPHSCAPAPLDLAPAGGGRGGQHEAHDGQQI